MIKVKRTSPIYLAVTFTGDFGALSKELEDNGIVAVVQPHTRLGDTEALYAQVDFGGTKGPVFIQKGEYMLFTENLKNFVTTASEYGFNSAFETV